MEVLVAIPMAIFLVIVVCGGLAYTFMAAGLGVLWCIKQYGLFPVVGSLVLLNSGIVYALVRIRRWWKRVDAHR